jgi:hypothetical protein
MRIRDVKHSDPEWNKFGSVIRNTVLMFDHLDPVRYYLKSNFQENRIITTFIRHAPICLVIKYKK